MFYWLAKYFPIKQENGSLSVCQWVNTDCSTHPKGTNKKRARCACFHYFAVVIRHLISRPQRCQNLRQTSQQKLRILRKPRNGYESPPYDDQIAVPCRNAIDGEGHFLAFISDLTSAWRMITYQKVVPLCKFHRIREAIIEERKVFHRKKFYL